MTNAVARPSTVTGADYNQLSTSFFQNVNKVLTGGQTPQNAVSEVEKVANRIMRQTVVGRIQNSYLNFFGLLTAHISIVHSYDVAPI
jgi:hypothetical protein